MKKGLDVCRLKFSIENLLLYVKSAGRSYVPTFHGLMRGIMTHVPFFKPYTIAYLENPLNGPTHVDKHIVIDCANISYEDVGLVYVMF